MDFRQVPAKSGQLSHFKQLLTQDIEDILVIDGDIPRFRIILNYTQRWQESLPRFR